MKTARQCHSGDDRTRKRMTEQLKIADSAWEAEEQWAQLQANVNGQQGVKGTERKKTSEDVEN